MTNEQRERVYRLERYLLVDRDKIYTNVRVNDLDTVLSLIKENQTEIEIYKEELDSIYKALDIERGVARPRTYEIIQALKNTTIFTSTVIFDVEKLGKELISMPNVRRGQDTATWWKVLKTGVIAHGLNENLSLYRRSNNTLSSNKMKALKRTWNLYRNVEHFSVFKSFYYFCWYVFNAIRRRI